MAELTDEQVKRAGDAMEEFQRTPGKGGNWYDLARTAAPFLQLPWDEPTEKDFPSAKSNAEYILAHVLPFVRRRNASLPPKPVDPRRLVIIKVLESHDKLGLNFESVAEEILEYLAKVKQ